MCPATFESCSHVWLGRRPSPIKMSGPKAPPAILPKELAWPHVQPVISLHKAIFKHPAGFKQVIAKLQIQTESGGLYIRLVVIVVVCRDAETIQTRTNMSQSRSDLTGQARPDQTRPDLLDTMVDFPATMIDLPDTMVDLPDAMVGLSDTTVDLPDTMVDCPVTRVDLPDTMVDLLDHGTPPDTMVDLPDTMVDLPDTMVDLPDTIVEVGEVEEVGEVGEV